MLVSDKVYLDLKDKIQYGEFLPGVHLVESDLMESYGASRATIREALRRLAEDEIIERIPNKGIIVRKLTKEDVYGYYFILQQLESAAVRIVAEEHTEEQYLKIKALIEEDQAAIDQLDYRRHARNVFRIRNEIVVCTGIGPLIKLVNKIFVLAAIYYNTNPGIMPLNITESHAAHQKLLEAIRNGDGDTAEATIRDMLQAVINTLGK